MLKHSVDRRVCVESLTHILVLMTTATKREAQEIAQNLLEKQLIACANICGPVESRFQWQGRIEKAEEFMVLMKSDQQLFPKLARAAKKMHSYEVPEILAVPIIKGFQPYMKWLTASLQTHGES